MKEITKRLGAVGATRLPGWGPRDPHCAWLETLQDMAANRCQWRPCCQFLSRLPELSNKSWLYGSEALVLSTDVMVDLMMMMTMCHQKKALGLGHSSFVHCCTYVPNPIHVDRDEMAQVVRARIYLTEVPLFEPDLCFSNSPARFGVTWKYPALRPSCFLRHPVNIYLLMGNQIAGLTPPPVISAEECLSDISGLVRVEEELFGSRLFKVAKARRVDDGSSQLVVIKTFPSTRATQLLSDYRPLIKAYCRQITSGFNLLYFHVRVSPAERNILLFRDYVDQTLVDRLSTRPFLCLEEKKWIAFQLLQAVAQLHRVPGPSSMNKPDEQEGNPTEVLCHGDIKAENVLLTSWGWVLLSDPAPFKPCWLPADNPSEFTHYFDSTRRRVCYLAPERFIQLQPNPGLLDPTQKCVESLTMLPNGQAVILDSDSNEDGLDGRVQIGGAQPGSGESGEKPRSSDENRHNTPSEPSGLTPAFVTQGTPDMVSESIVDKIALQIPARTTLNDPTPRVNLVPAMDLFSVGCVFLELFTDGSVAFTLADLLGYRANDTSRLSKLLEQIHCEDIKILISSLLSLDPNERGSAEGHLDNQRGKAFPEVFYSHLLPYMQTFLRVGLRNPTVRIVYIRRTLSSLLQEIAECDADSLSTCAVLLCNLVTSVLRPSGNCFITQTPSTMALPMSSVQKEDAIPVHDVNKQRQISGDMATGSFVERRLLEYGKVNALLCYLELSKYMNVSLFFDRIIPYCVDLTSPVHSGEVRSLALECLTQILRKATEYTANQSKTPHSLEVYFLTEYLFPTLAPLSVDPKMEVRLTYSRCLPVLAESALRFLDSSNLLSRRRGSSGMDVSNAPQKSPSTNQLAILETAMNTYDAHLSLLRAHIQDRFADLDRQIRHALVNTGSFGWLAAFFGPEHISGTLLSHMITFLNDKTDHGLRTSFYRQIVPLVTGIGVQSVSVVRPLLEQGLIDPNETVVEACLHSLTQLLRRQLLSPPVAVSFLTRCLALTTHPTRRIRQSAVGYIATFARLATTNTEANTGANGTISARRVEKRGRASEREPLMWTRMCTPASVYARLANAETSKIFFRRSVRRCFTSDAVLLTSLQPSISRTILDSLVSFVTNASSTCNSGPQRAQHVHQLLDRFFKVLKERETSRSITRSNETPCYTSPDDEVVASLLATLQWQGLTDLMESQILLLAPLVKVLCEAGNECTWAAAPVRGGHKQPPKAPPKCRTRVIDTQHIISRSVRRCFTSDAVLLTSLQPSISRTILDSLVSFVTNASSTCNSGPQRAQHVHQLLDRFFKVLKERETSRSITRSNETPCYTSPDDEVVASLLATLQWQGLTDLMESQILLLAPLVKVLCEAGNECTWAAAPVRGGHKQPPKAPPKCRTRVIDTQHIISSALLPSKTPKVVFPEDPLRMPDFPSYLRQLAVSLQPPISNYERLLRRDLFSGRIPLSVCRSTGNDQRWTRLVWTSATPSGGGGGSGGGQPESTDFMDGSITRLGNHLNHSTSVPTSMDKRYGVENTGRSDVQLQGMLVAHLQEHRPGLISLAAHGSGRLLASCSSGDGTVKLWNCGLWPVDSDGYLNQLSSTGGPVRNMAENTAIRQTASRPAGLMHIHALPTRSSWTYNCFAEEQSPKSCRGLVWMTNGSSLVTVADYRSLHRIDMETGYPNGLVEQLSASDPSRVVCLASSACSQFPAHLSLLQPRIVGGGDSNLVTYATTSNLIIGRDLRVPFSSPPAWCLKQDRGSGLIRSLVMHSCHTWLVTGTSRNQLVSWDLRYERPVACVQHQHSNPQRQQQGHSAILKLNLAETVTSQLRRGFHLGEDVGRRRTLIVASSDRNNGVTIWDLEACASASSAAATERTLMAPQTHRPVVNGGLVAASWARPATTLDYSPVRSVLCLPQPNSQTANQGSGWPTIVSGGDDGRIRLWNFSKASNSRIFAHSAGEAPIGNRISYSEVVDHGVRTIQEKTDDSGNLMATTERPDSRPARLLEVRRPTMSRSDLAKSTADSAEADITRSNGSGFPTEGRLEQYMPSVGHRNIISDLSLIRTSHYLLVSASMDGVIKIWR
ncbi:hypothetical protein T265_00185 [Opisthorchis viverrini]|uniref:non-specific serine/threonine protein kinase n=1 Tax=Opisthorchis viverrini TaxID=6198 RepID=A0A075AD27_OPIVI|nr:hypothetical protein T265_00185 [Opisthorchis viverrini]KER33980.1 hypothetical protein T265_00185 [Opisthorchis viverrini]